MHLAAENGLAEAVNVLLQRKAPLELRYKSGLTPLVAAIKNTAIVPTQSILHWKQHGSASKALDDHEMVVYLVL